MRRSLLIGLPLAVLLGVPGSLVLDPASAQTLATEVVPLECDGPVADAEPGTEEFRQRDAMNMACSEQRKFDQAQHPNTTLPLTGQDSTSERATHDGYRQPSRHDDVRFRFERLTANGVAAELYRPCPTDARVCAALPEGLQRADGPYPAVVVLHGAASNRENHWWASQPLAEAGYLVLAVDGTDRSVVGAALDWLTSAENPYAAEIDVARIGVAGHSLGAGNALSTQGDPRVSAIVAWDPCSSIPCQDAPELLESDQLTPTLYQMADYTGWPGYPEPRTSVPGTLRTEGFEGLRDRGVDAMVITGRATTHLDWVTLTRGNRLAESTWSYFNLAWFDRYLKGKLVQTGDQTGEQQVAERRIREAIAQEAFSRLTADTFDGSADRHNISQGFWDPVQAATSLDPLYGGNVPYRVQGMPVADRLSFYHRSVCFISAPNYTARGDGAPLKARADTGLDGDMRTQGCRP